MANSTFFNVGLETCCGSNRRLLNVLRLRGQGQCEMKGGAGAELAFSPGAASVGLHDVLDDGEAEACASEVAGARLIDPVEALEDALQVF